MAVNYTTFAITTTVTAVVSAYFAYVKGYNRGLQYGYDWGKIHGATEERELIENVARSKKQ